MPEHVFKTEVCTWQLVAHSAPSQVLTTSEPFSKVAIVDLLFRGNARQASSAVMEVLCGLEQSASEKSVEAMYLVGNSGTTKAQYDKATRENKTSSVFMVIVSEDYYTTRVPKKKGGIEPKTALS